MDLKNVKFLIPVAIALGAGVVGYLSYCWFGPDNPIEEGCEQIIQSETGQKIDLSPNSAAEDHKVISEAAKG